MPVEGKQAPANDGAKKSKLRKFSENLQSEGELVTMRNMGLPSDWKIVGKTKASRMSQIGSSVPPVLAEAIGWGLRRMLVEAGATTIDSFMRAAGNSICKYCDKEFSRHPISKIDADQGILLRELCCGLKVKL
jgi:hypothetical protein